MPHFENIENYESTNPKSGQKKIIPIAPHSMQASDFRPRRREPGGREKPIPKSQFKEVQIEPISVRQMEKEFRQASRKEARRKPRLGLKGWLLRIRRAIASHFRGKRSRVSGRPPHSHSLRNRRSPNRPPQGKGKPGDQAGKPSSEQHRRGGGPRKPRPDEGGQPQRPSGEGNTGKPSSRRPRRGGRNSGKPPQNRDHGHPNRDSRPKN